jgi:hypothetical protein
MLRIKSNCRKRIHKKEKEQGMVINAMETPATKVCTLLNQPGLLIMPCCFDALSAKLIERAGL